MKFFEKNIKKFYFVYGRKNLPWRKKVTDYSVWVSEIMLQQTQVSRVIEYYNNFLKKFPTIYHLARALWKEFFPYFKGLGYYRRAKCMLATAKIVVRHYGGIFPQEKKLSFTIEKKHNWQFGGEFINRIKRTQNNLGIFRLTEDYLKSGEYEIELALQDLKDKRLFKISKDFKKSLENNIIFLRAIDSKNGKKIQLEDIRKYDIKGLVGKSTSRNLAHLIFKKEVSLKEQEDLMKRFNEELNKNRSQYFSFFLTNFRDNNRKRISFDMAYKLLNYIYYEK